MSMSYILIRQTEPYPFCICSVWCVLLESACDQHRANQHCPDRGQGFCNS
ncbi:unnamed protein product [Staurois parvus]|uniref:Uncharacterized protein n=1 Tax=Staurois parvus TaxID=386267 RepID=A0ABN9C8D1_9NEOB|nr:unnamed protein product [Staurois parvus]